MWRVWHGRSCAIKKGRSKPHVRKPHSLAASAPWSMHRFASQTELPVQFPQLPLQPSFPHCFPEHWGWQHDVPFKQVCGHGHVPHWPPQPSLPHTWPEQSGMHDGPHVPLEHEPPPGHWSLIPVHLPPQPSGSPQSGQTVIGPWGPGHPSPGSYVNGQFGVHGTLPSYSAVALPSQPKAHATRAMRSSLPCSISPPLCPPSSRA